MKLNVKTNVIERVKNKSKDEGCGKQSTWIITDDNWGPINEIPSESL